MTANAHTDMKFAQTTFQQALNGLPVDTPVNRLGEIIVQDPERGEVRRARVMGIVTYFAWGLSGGAEPFDTELEARNYLGLPMPRVGMDEEGYGPNRLGKLVERVGDGEIHKAGTLAAPIYFAWEFDQAVKCPSLARAREVLGKVIEHNNPKTAPKSSYKQNSKGYKPDGK